MERPLEENGLLLQPGGGRLSLYTISSGSEKEAIPALDRINSKQITFKALGSVDVVAIADTSSNLVDPPSGTTPHILRAQHVKLVKWGGAYHSPNLHTWLSNRKVVGLVCLKLDRLLYLLTSPFDKLKHTILYIENMLKHLGLETAIYGGLGDVDLFLLINAESFEVIFQAASELRSVFIRDVFELERNELSDDLQVTIKQGEALDFPLFAGTNIIPLVSYEKIIKPQSYGELKDEVLAAIRITCPPATESVSKQFAEDLNASLYARCGNNELLLDVPSKIASGELVKRVLEFRGNWNESNAGALATETYLYSQNINEKQARWGFSIDWDGDSNEDHPQRIDGPEKVLKDFKKTNEHFHLHSSVMQFLNYYQSLLQDKRFAPAVMGMKNVRGAIVGEIKRYLLDRKENKHRGISSIVEAVLSHARTGIAQRLEMQVLGVNGSGVSQGNYDGVLSSILAVEALLGSVYDDWFSVSPSLPLQRSLLDQEWPGFVYFSSIWGYSLRYASIYTLPDEAAYQPFSEDVNWLTLTHELSHDVFNQLKVDEDLKKYLNYSISCSRMDGERFEVTELEAAQNIPEFAVARSCYWELFANWFDFYHFYDSDVDLFFSNIWKCWLKVPTVKINLRRYIVRSFVVYLLTSVDKLRYAYSQDEEEGYVRDQFDNFVLLLRKHISTFREDKIELLKDDVVEKAGYYAIPMCDLISDYRFDAFRNIVNRTYDTLDVQVDCILRGEVIDGNIENPFLLYKECLKQVLESHKSTDKKWLASSAFILSMRGRRA